jgi:hypothetical protein
MYEWARVERLGAVVDGREVAAVRPGNFHASNVQRRAAGAVNRHLALPISPFVFCEYCWAALRSVLEVASRSALSRQLLTICRATGVSSP